MTLDKFKILYEEELIVAKPGLKRISNNLFLYIALTFNSPFPEDMTQSFTMSIALNEQCDQNPLLCAFFSESDTKYPPENGLVGSFSNGLATIHSQSGLEPGNYIFTILTITDGYERGIYACYTND